MAGLTAGLRSRHSDGMLRGIRNFVFSWWGFVLMSAIVLAWICLLVVIILAPRNAITD